MNKISSFISSLQHDALGFQMWFAAVLLQYEYETNITLREFTLLDGDDFVDFGSDT